MKKSENVKKLKANIISGISILMVREFGMKLVSVIGQLILVRILAPEIFGVFAVITFIYSSATFFGDIGLTQAIIQYKGKLSEVMLSSIFLLKLFMAIVSYIILATILYFTASLYRDLSNIYIPATLLLGLTYLPNSLKSVMIALMDRNLQYKSISIVDFLGMMSYYLVSILLAIYGLYIWNFVLGLIVKEIAELILAYYFVRWLPKFTFKFNNIRKMVKFGFFVQIGSILGLVHNGITPIVGNYLFGAIVVGYLDWGRSISSIPNSLLDSFGRVALSGMSKIQDNVQFVAKAIDKSTSMLNLILYPFVAFILCYGSDFIQFIATDKWMPALPALWVFALTAIFTGGIVSVGHGIMATGHAKLLTYVSVLVILNEIVIVFILTKLFGFIGIPISFFITNLVQYFLYFIMGRKLNIPIKIRKPFINKLFILISTIFFSLGLNLLFPTGFYSFILKSLITVVFYILIVRQFSKEEFYEMLTILRERITYKKINLLN